VDDDARHLLRLRVDDDGLDDADPSTAFHDDVKTLTVGEPIPTDIAVDCERVLDWQRSASARNRGNRN
jgi:hypothetical protein